MADISKAKIAAAKKKLRQFQSKATKADSISYKTFTSADNETQSNDSLINVNNATEYNEVGDIHPHHHHAMEPFTTIEATHQSMLNAKSESSPPFQHSSNSSIQLSSDDSGRNAAALEIPSIQTEFQRNIQQATDKTANDLVVIDDIYKQPAAVDVHPIHNYGFKTEITNSNTSKAQQPQLFDDTIRSQLEIEKMKNLELNAKVLQQQQQIHDMNTALKQAYDHMQQMPTMAKNSDALQRTVDVLVKEKSDLTAKLQQKEQAIVEQDSGITELKSRLGASRHRVAELEKDLNTIKASNAKHNDEFQQGIHSELDLLKTENERLKQLYQDACSENTEIQHQLSKKIKTIGEMEQRFDAKCKELEIAQLHLQQLTSSSSEALSQREATNNDAEHSLNNQQQQLNQSNSNRQIIELQNLVSELTNDRDASQQQYQTYVHHLNNEIATLTHKNQELNKQIDKLTKREESLVDHVRELEKQIQKNISVKQRLTALEHNDKPDHMHLDSDRKVEEIKKELDDLRTKVAASEETKQQLNVQLQDMITAKIELEQQIVEKDTKLTELAGEMEKIKAECPMNTSGVLATMESDKLAASKSMTQNQELKKQLDEIQKAYIQVSNDKLELATQLQSEQYSANDIKQRFGGIEEELRTVKEKLFFKDEEMIRLAHENTHLTSEVAKLEDKYKSENEELSRKYTLAKREISYLTKKLQSLNKRDTKEQTDTNTTTTTTTANENESETIVVQEIQTTGDNNPNDTDKENAELIENDDSQNDESTVDHLDSEQKLSSIVDSNDNLDAISVTSTTTINIATEEAMCKLQDRFKRTMTEIAELTDEKQRLEHLVLQLQSETETIGEYIALYQTQRRLLKQREAEKDIQLHRIAADREDMKNKLEQLNRLVELLLISKGITNPHPSPEQILTEHGDGGMEDSHKNNSVDGNHMDAQNDSLATPPLNESNCCPSDDGISHIPKSIAEIPAAVNTTKETATQIINLLTEIKETNLKTTDSSMVPFSSLNHCPCCSGSLEIV